MNILQKRLFSLDSDWNSGWCEAYNEHKMSVRYSRIPTEDDMESGYGGLTFDYSSAFSFQNDPSRSYKSAFTYSSQFKQQQSGDNLRFETGVFGWN